MRIYERKCGRICTSKTRKTRQKMAIKRRYFPTVWKYFCYSMEVSSFIIQVTSEKKRGEDEFTRHVERCYMGPNSEGFPRDFRVLGSNYCSV